MVGLCAVVAARGRERDVGLRGRCQERTEYEGECDAGGEAVDRTTRGQTPSGAVPNALRRQATRRASPNPARRQPGNCGAESLRDLNPASQEDVEGCCGGKPQTLAPGGERGDITTVVVGTTGAGAPGDMHIPALRTQGA
jgi:hypothetical protein